MKKSFCVLFMFFLFGAAVFSEEQTPLSFYENELVKTEYTAMGGFTLSYQGISSGITLGVQDEIESALMEYPESRNLIEGYKSKILSGNVLLWGGLAAVFTGAYYPLIASGDPDIFEYSSLDGKIALSLMVGGLVTELIGGFMIQFGYQDLFNSVNQFNYNRMRDYSDR